MRFSRELKRFVFIAKVNHFKATIDWRLGCKGTGILRNFFPKRFDIKPKRGRNRIKSEKNIYSGFLQVLALI